MSSSSLPSCAAGRAGCAGWCRGWVMLDGAGAGWCWMVPGLGGVGWCRGWVVLDGVGAGWCWMVSGLDWVGAEWCRGLKGTRQCVIRAAQNASAAGLRSACTGRGCYRSGGGGTHPPPAH
eukprot:365336-Chlamydomonas_euryale.AAC.3